MSVDLTGRFWKLLAKADEVHRITWRLPFLTYPIRLLSSTVNRVVELTTGQGHPNNRAITEFRIGQNPTGKSGGRSTAPLGVLFFTVRGWYAHVGTEAVLARGLANFGISSAFFLCGGGLSQCDFKPGSDPYVTTPLCWRCTSFGERVIEAAGFRSTKLEDVIGTSTRSDAEGLVADLSRHELMRFTYAGLELGELTMPSVHHALLRGSVGEDHTSVNVLRGFIASAIVMVEACDALLRELKPETVFMTNGLFFAEAVMMNRAAAAGVRVITYERGVRPNTLILAVNRAAIPFDMGSIWKTSEDIPLTPLEAATLDSMLDERRAGRVGSQMLWPAMTRPVVNPKALSRTVLFSNVTWDTAVYNAAGAFETVDAWIRHTVSIFSALPDHELIIRAHPAEVRLGPNVTREPVSRMLAAVGDDLPSNVRFVGPNDATSSYELIDAADRVLVYASTVGLEAALAGKTVIVAGDTHYKGRGFTFDPVDPYSYEAAVRSSITAEALDPAKRESARRYAYAFFFRFNIDFPWLSDASRDSRSIDLQGIEISDHMKALCELIVGRELSLPRA